MTLVPTGAVVPGTGAPFAGRLVFCSYTQDRLKVLEAPGRLSDGPEGCALDVTEGPDHALYFSDRTEVRRFAG